MTKRYDIALIGATALACGWIDAARARGLRCAVIDAGCTAGAEFSLAWKNEGTAPDAKEDRALLDEISAAAGTQAQDPLWLPAVSVTIHRHLARSGSDCYFLSRVGEIALQEDTYRLTLHSIGGKTEILASYIADTTARFETRGIWQQQKPQAKAVHLGVCLEGRDAGLERITEGSNLVLCKLPLENDMSVSAAHDIAQRQAPLYPIVMLAQEVSFTPCEEERMLGGYAAWLPSAFHGSVTAAYTAGLRHGEQPKNTRNERRAPCALPVYDEPDVDIAVAGLGTAGGVAAAAAAINGKRVLGVEQFGCQGGTGTIGAIMGYYHGVKGGLYRQIDQEATAIEKEAFVAYPHIGAAGKIIAHQRWAQRSGVTCAYDSLVVGVEKEADRVTGLRYLNADGLHRVHAGMVLDCTADGVVSRLAGCEMLDGRAADGHYVTYSLVTVYYDSENKRVHGGYFDNGTVSQYDTLALGKAIALAGADPINGAPFLSGAKTAICVAPYIGLRGGERTAGVDTLDMPAFLNGTFEDKAAYYVLTNLDNHSKDNAFESRIVRDWLTVCGMWGYDVEAPVPYTALIPRRVDGLLAAGRQISMSHDVSLGVRMKDDASKSGEAAAVLACLALELGVEARAVPYETLRQRLLRTDCLKDSDRSGIIRQKDGTGRVWELPDSSWETDLRAIEEGLSSDQPGYFIWSASLLDQLGQEKLREWLKSDRPLLRANSALALSLAEDPAACGVVLEMLRDRSGYVPKTSWMYVPPHAVSFISAAGRLGMAEAVEPLIAILENPAYTDGIPFEPGRFMMDREDLSFQFRSHALAALIEILRKRPETRNAAAPRVSRVLAAEDFSLRSTMMGPLNIRQELCDTARKIWHEFLREAL